MAKRTQLEKVILQLESERDILQLAIDRLKAQAANKPTRARKLKIAGSAAGA